MGTQESEPGRSRGPRARSPARDGSHLGDATPNCPGLGPGKSAQKAVRSATSPIDREGVGGTLVLPHSQALPCSLLFNMQSSIKDARIHQGLEREGVYIYFLATIYSFLICCKGRGHRDLPSPFRIRVTIFLWLYSISCMTQGPLLNIRWPDLRIYAQTYCSCL